jgi:hypothetical protein
MLLKMNEAMKKNLPLIVLFTVVLVLPSCKFKTMYDEKANMDIIRKDIRAGHCKLGVVKEIRHATGDTAHFIELSFEDSPLFRDGTTDLSYLASHCAIKAFRLFSPGIWDGMEGMSIVFKGDAARSDTRRYYPLNELQDLRRVTAMFDRLIGALETARTESLVNNTDRLAAADSVKIASCFFTGLLSDNPDLVRIFLNAYKDYNTDLDKADRKYYFKRFKVSDSFAKDIRSEEVYQLEATFIEPLHNDLFRMKFIVSTEDPEKLLSLDMEAKE